MTENNLPPEPPPVFLPEPKREPAPEPHIPARRATVDDLKFDFPADAPPEEPEPARRGNTFSRFVFWVILGVMLMVGIQSGSPIPMIIVIAAAFLFRKRLRRDR